MRKKCCARVHRVEDDCEEGVCDAVSACDDGGGLDRFGRGAMGESCDIMIEGTIKSFGFAGGIMTNKESSIVGPQSVTTLI